MNDNDGFYFIGSHVLGMYVSQILKTLYRTYSNMKMKPLWNDINPKAVTTDELFGYLHPATREWKDGEENINVFRHKY